MIEETITLKISKTISVVLEKKMLKSKFILCDIMIRELAKEIDILKDKIKKMGVDKRHSGCHNPLIS